MSSYQNTRYYRRELAARLRPQLERLTEQAGGMVPLAQLIYEASRESQENKLVIHSFHNWKQVYNVIYEIVTQRRNKPYAVRLWVAQLLDHCVKQLGETGLEEDTLGSERVINMGDPPTEEDVLYPLGYQKKEVPLYLRVLEAIMSRDADSALAFQLSQEVYDLEHS